MASKPKDSKSKGKATASNKVDFGKGSKAKRTSIGNSKNSRPKHKDAVRAKKGR